MSNMQNIIAYCNVDRYKETKYPDVFYDPDTKTGVRMPLAEFTACKTGSGNRKPAVLTVNIEDQVKDLPRNIFNDITNGIASADLNEFLCMVSRYCQTRTPFTSGTYVFASSLTII